MFQPETEDMLPRMAPKPSSDSPSGASQGIVRPQVPEVSILFAQQDSNMQKHVFNIPQQQHNESVPQQTYASWKKQMLPKVTYQASANMTNIQAPENNMMNDYNCARTNVYPTGSNINPNINIANTNAFGVCTGTQQAYRRSLESCISSHCQPLPIMQPQPPLLVMNHLTNTTPGEVLTICAGTQTDAILESTSNYLHISRELWSNCASKKDIDNLRQILDEIRFEQQRMAKMLETILLSHHSQLPAKTYYDIGVQVDCAQSDINPPYDNGDTDTFHGQSIPKNKFLQHLKPVANTLQTPKGKPMAQSTTYRPNSPQPVKQDFLDLAPTPISQQLSSKPTPIMCKSASETSLAMNELALKYLPNEKLAELLNELNMNSPIDTGATNAAPTPDRTNKHKFEKGPSDISNASYKYLKKYRLLPEDYDERGNIDVNNANEKLIENGNDNQIPQYNSPQYNNIQNTPLSQKQTPTNPCSPYAGRLPLSPLARVPSPPQHIVNLENIKHQPKFL